MTLTDVHSVLYFQGTFLQGAISMLVWSRRFLVRKEEILFRNNNLDRCCCCCCCAWKICVNAFGPSTIMQGKATEVSTKYDSFEKIS